MAGSSCVRSLGGRLVSGVESRGGCVVGGVDSKHLRGKVYSFGVGNGRRVESSGD